MLLNLPFRLFLTFTSFHFMNSGLGLDDALEPREVSQGLVGQAQARKSHTISKGRGQSQQKSYNFEGGAQVV